MPRYIDLRTDFGFKRLFGREDSKDILKQFLVDILALPYPIAELTYIPVEQLPASPAERRGIYDVYCIDTMGQRFIVEMQQVRQLHIKERALYYSTFAITYQAQRGAEWRQHTAWDKEHTFSWSGAGTGACPSAVRNIVETRGDSGLVTWDRLCVTILRTFVCKTAACQLC